MRQLLAITILIAIPTSSAAAESVVMSPAVQKDVQCFLIFALKTGSSKDRTDQLTAGLAETYYLGKVRAEAPAIDLTAAVSDQVSLLAANSANSKDVRDACVDEFGRALDQVVAIKKRGSQPSAPAAK